MTTRKVFYSFHYMPDAWRASQVRNMGVVEGPVSGYLLSRSVYRSRRIEARVDVVDELGQPANDQ
jgi:hypothetical protein